MGTVPENFHGVVGKSGRKNAYEEWNKTNAINKLWEKVNNKVMAGEQLSDYEEKLVLSILPKTIKTETDVNANVSMTVNIDKEVANKYDINASTENNSEGQTPIQSN